MAALGTMPPAPNRDERRHGGDSGVDRSIAKDNAAAPDTHIGTGVAIMTSPRPESAQESRRPGAGRKSACLSGLASSIVVVLAPAASRATSWIVTVGGGAGVSPPYEGAGHDIVQPILTFNLRRANVPYRFVPPDGGSTISLFSRRHLVFGPIVRFRYPRGDTNHLAGLDKIGAAAEPGAFAEVWPVDWMRFRAEGRYGVGGYNGPVGDAAIDLIHTGRTWDFSIGPRCGYGGADYMDTYFGVTPIEAARSPLIKTAYEPGAGERYLGVEAALAHNWTHRIKTTFAMGYHRLAHLAEESPVVQLAGSPNDYSAGVTLSYSFGWKIGR
jgi:outer membrane scaffolding protein for murein synthesis (MipA/OmpV family)